MATVLRRCVSVCLGVVLAGCLSPRQPTQAIVYVDAQPVVSELTRRLSVSVRSGPRADLMPYSETYDYTLPADAPIFARDFTFVPLGGDLSRIFEITATAYDAERQVITVARMRGGFRANTPRVFRLLLEDACRGIVCPSDTTCRAGECVQLLDPDEDAGVDPDAGVPEDAPPQSCTTDEECDDDVYCNGVEVCKGGTCQPGDMIVCDDGVDCTEDVCQGTRCTYLPNNGLCTDLPDGRCDVANDCQYGVCNDTICVSDGCVTATCNGALCERSSTCSGATSFCCAGTCAAPGCDDGLSCTNDYCGETGCVHEPRTGSCDDGDACTGDGTCEGTRCRSAAPIDCDDDNPCTDDSCDPMGGCQHVPNDANAYTDGDPCTVGDRCSAGTGMAGTMLDCTDAFLCTNDTCVGGTCQHTGMDSRCTASLGGRCDPMSGCQYGTCTAASCTATDACEMAVCDTPSHCARTPLCTGTCCGGTCCTEDSNPCTDTVCSGTSCTVVNNTRPCDDLDPCTVGDTCGGGSCRGVPRCTTTDPCRTATCTAGTCSTPAVANGTPCNRDGDLCTLDQCVGGTCTLIDPNPCDDGNECTFDTCSASGACTYENAFMGSSCGIGSGCAPYVCDGFGACIDDCGDLGQTCCDGRECTEFSLCPFL